MANLSNKRILLGVSGGIAAYKSADFVRRLRDAGAEVRVVMTRAAKEFITPLTLETVSDHPVYEHLLEDHQDSTMEHIHLARWADAVVVAPASADFMARLTQGRADDLLSAICLAADIPVAIAPAMNQQMWRNAATQRNVNQLVKNGVFLFGPAEGNQACGETGPGRMLDPVELVETTAALFDTGELEGINILLTAGPTWEALDPVRGLTNASSGKMGYALAKAAMEAGARVTLVSGPTQLEEPERVAFVPVESAIDMYEAVMEFIEKMDVFIGVAAVADYRPSTVAEKKIKKKSESLIIELVRNPDIIASVASLDKPPFTVGFAAETDQVETYAQDKLIEKQIDMICANRIGIEGMGIGSDDNALIVLDSNGKTEFDRQPKEKLARLLIQHIGKRYHAKHSASHTRPTSR